MKNIEDLRASEIIAENLFKAGLNKEDILCLLAIFLQQDAQCFVEATKR